MAGLTLPNFSTMLPPIKQDGFKVLVIASYNGMGENGDWPRYVLFPPRVGDFLQSGNGDTKKIIAVIHFAEADGSAAVALRLGDDNTSNTGSNG